MEHKQQTPTGGNQPRPQQENIINNDYSTTKEAALSYAKMGWPVIPLNGKIPWIKGWVNTASTDPEQIKQWFKKRPGSNVGILTGERAGFFVLDVDVEKGGIVSLDLLEHEHGKLPDTLTVKTGSGGFHYYYKYPEGGLSNSRGDLYIGIDIRGQGGQVCAPPSLHKTGNTYEWIDSEPGETPIAEAPEWLLEKLKPQPGETKNPSMYLNGVYEEGTRNNSLTSLAGKLRHSGLDEPEIADALLTANTNRCKPPLPETEVLGIVKSVGRYPKSEVTGTTVSISKRPEALSDDAFHGLAGEIVRLIEPHTEADPVALLLQFLAFFGNVVGRGAYFVAEADKHYPNLFIIIVGQTAKARKGTSLGHIEKIFKGVDIDWFSSCRHSGLSSGEGLIWVIHDPIEKSEPIRAKDKTITGYQTVITDPGVEDKRALVVESEFCSPLKVMSREGNTLSAIIRNAFDGKDLQSMTKNSPARATDPHISIIGHITKDELIRHVDSTELCNGFINRYGLAFASRSKILPEGGKIDEVDFNPLITRLRDAVNFAKSAGELKRDEKARALWHKVYPELSEGKPGLVGAAIARAEAQVMRLALIYALLDRSDTIRQEHLMAGIAVWDYCEASARYVFGSALGDPVADQIQRSLDSRPDGMTRTEISKTFNRHKSSSQIERALSTLSENGLAYCVIEKGEGRSVERWFSTKHSAKQANKAN